MKNIVSFLLFHLTLTVLAPAQSAPVLWDTQPLPEAGHAEVVPRASSVIDFDIFDFDLDEHQELGILRRHSDHPFVLAINELQDYEYSYKQTKVNIWRKLPRLFKMPSTHPYYWFTYNATNEGQGTIHLYDRKFTLIDSISTLAGIDKTDTGIWAGFLNSAHTLDLNNDNRNDLLISINTGGDGQPRVLLGYDLYTKEEIFRKFFAPMVKRVEVVDIYNDSHPLIIIGLGGASDGPFFGDFKRDHSYLVILDIQGNVVKSWEFGGESSYIQYVVEDINQDHIKEIIVTYFCYRNDNTDPSKLAIIDGRTLDVVAEKVYMNNPIFFNYPSIIHSAENDRRTILTTNSSSDLALHFYNWHTGALIERKHVKAPAQTRFILQDDLDHDGNDELFFHSRSLPGFIITNTMLEPMAKLKLFTNSPVNNFKKLDQPTPDTFQYIFLADSTLYRWEIKGGRDFPPKLISHSGAWRAEWRFNYLVVAILGFFGVSVFVLWVLIRRYFTPGENPLYSKRSAGILLTTKGKMLACNNYMFEIAELPITQKYKHKSIREIFQSTHVAPIIPAFERFVESGQTHLLTNMMIGPAGQRKAMALEIMWYTGKPQDKILAILLIDLTNSIQTERLKLWGAMAQRVAHKTKTPLGIVMLAIQRLQRQYSNDSPELAERYDKHTKTALEEIERVRKIINSFIKFARLDEPIFEMTNFNDFIRDLVAAYQSRLPENISLKTSFENFIAIVNIDKSQIEEAINNIIDNAATAMNGEGTIHVATNMETHPLDDGTDYAIVEIIDDADGMSSEELNQLFTPGFTTSEFGTGMGMVITKSLIENHDGDINVTSIKGLGTTVSIRLPIQNKGKSND